MKLDMLLDQLESADLVRRTLEIELEYLFKHALTQEATYQTLLQKKRREIHQLIAQDIERLYANSLDEHAAILAFHFEKAGVQDKALEYDRRAGDVAARVYTNPEALSFYSQALDLATRVAPAAQTPILLALGRILENTSAWEAAEARYREALDLAQGPEAERFRAQAKTSIGNTYMARWMPTEAVSWLTEARGDFERLGDQAGMGQVAAQLGSAYWKWGKLDEAQSFLDQSLALQGEDGDKRRLAETFLVLGNIASSRPDLAAASGWWQKSLDVSREIGDKLGVARGCGNLAVAAMMSGQLDAARTLSSEALTLFEEMGALRELGQMRGLNSLVLIMQGHFAEARKLILQDLSLYRELGAQAEFGVDLIGLAQATLGLDESPTGSRAAAKLVGVASRLHALIGATLLPMHQMRVDGVLAVARSRATQAEIDAAWAEGQAIDWPSAQVYAMQFSESE